ncbi:hypothetical protein QW71_08140 [Paenibacillus sp. IHB B 3415]|nr:hypothetical protein QW71_08140 [Paenibacillus sp. IHB B 3415]
MITHTNSFNSNQMKMGYGVSQICNMKKFVAVIASNGRIILFFQKNNIFCLPEAAAFPAAASLTFQQIRLFVRT